MKINKYNNKGFTLVELLITLAIMGIVIQLIYSLFFVGNKSFNISKNKGFAQQDVRIASIFLIDELRTVEKISNIGLTGKYYSLRLENGKIFRKVHNGDGSEPDLYISNNIDNINFKYTKEIKMEIINIFIEAKEGELKRDEQSKEIDFNILLENSPNYDKVIDQAIIYYSKYDWYDTIKIQLTW